MRRRIFEAIIPLVIITMIVCVVWTRATNLPTIAGLDRTPSAKEVDGDPLVFDVPLFIFPNGTLTEVTGVSVEYIPAAAGGGDFLADGSVPMTGIFDSASNWISGDGGAEGITIDALGNVGIGTSVPSALLDIATTGEVEVRITDTTASEYTMLTQEASDGAFTINRFGTGGDDFGIQADGDIFLGMFGSVGIGTAAPGSALDIVVDGESIALMRQFKYSDDGVGAAFHFRKARGSVGSEAVVQNNDVVGGFLFYGWNPDGSDFDHGASFRAKIDGTPSSGSDDSDMPMRLTFDTTPEGAGVPVERMSIKQDGATFMPAVYDDTISSNVRDLQIDDSGQLGYVSSSLKYKTNIRDLDDYSEVYQLRPRKYDRKDGSRIDEVGLIVEEVELIMPEIVSYKRGVIDNLIGEGDEISIFQTFYTTTEPETVSYSGLIIPLLVEVQNLKAEVETLKARITVLESR